MIRLYVAGYDRNIPTILRPYYDTFENHYLVLWTILAWVDYDRLRQYGLS